MECMKKSLIAALIIAPVIVIVLFIGVVRADDPSTTYLGSGYWNDPNAWSNGVPTYQKVAVVPAYESVNVNCDGQALRVEVGNYGYVKVMTTRKLYTPNKIKLGQYATLYVDDGATVRSPRIEGPYSASNPSTLSIDGGWVCANILCDSVNISINSAVPGFISRYTGI